MCNTRNSAAFHGNARLAKSVAKRFSVNFCECWIMCVLYIPKCNLDCVLYARIQFSSSFFIVDMHDIMKL